MRKFRFSLVWVLAVLFFVPVAAQSSFASLEPLVLGEDSLYYISVQFDPALRTWFDEEGAPQFGIAPPPTVATQLFEEWDVSFEPQISLNAQEKIALQMGIAPPPAANGFDLSSLIGLAWVKRDQAWSLEEARALGRRLLQLPQVLFVEIWPVTPIPLPVLEQEIISPPAATPNYEPNQGYLDSAQGINARYAWSKGIYGAGIKVADIEFGWNVNHEEFVGSGFTRHLTDLDDDHGTAVVGMLLARNNGTGVTGAIHQASVRGYSTRGGGTSNAIVEAAQWLSAGDVLLVELQVGTESAACSDANKYGPADYSPSIWNAVKAAVDAGIMVVAAAGNGGCNTNLYQNYKGDNGSIMVGAGNRERSWLSYSTHGSRVNLQGWGDWSVYSTGYGRLITVDGDLNRTYTHQFSGTSSASPIVVSAVALVQSYAKQKYGITLTLAQMRSLLINTGRAQTGSTSQSIGPLPNVRAAFLELDRIHGIVNLVLPDGDESLNGIYLLQNKNSGLYLVLDGGVGAIEDGANMMQDRLHADPNQQFRFEHIGKGSYRISVVHSGKVLDVASTSRDNGANIQQWSDYAKENQRFVAIPTGDGHHKLMARHSGKIVEVAGENKDPGANVQQWADNGQNCGEWKLIPYEDYVASIGSDHPNMLEWRVDLNGGILRFSAGELSLEKATVRLFDLMGQQISVTPLSPGTVDVSSLQPGIYLLDLQLNGRRYSKKVLKQ